ncbi:MAG TPA: ATP-binding protein [Kribbella sp.]|uniref:AlbA family DNA-binding domain-containing protein n=1 Tax=Kribbella sp. TaxID=1871183 RepID=UPI002D768C12|nr:ATP-binding protein [Kribbella sp.]HET6298896.1 ATP-binding protein [Kribbella sp.]
MPVVIVIDGRTDEEKLLELLAGGAEQQALDFKATLDLSQKSSADVLDLVKDCVAMSNLPTGGYIVVGVDNAGQPAHDQAGIDVSKFDSAALRARIARYTEATVNVISQHHEVNGRAVVLIYAEPNPDGLPVPFSSIGQYQRPDRSMDTAFREGEIVVREGTSNVRLRYSHWTALMQRYREKVRDEALQDANTLIGRFVSALGESREPAGRSTSVLPLMVGMDWDTFDDALTTHLETDSTVRLRRFLRAAANDASHNLPSTSEADDAPTSEYEDSLDAIAVVAIQATVHERADIFQLAVDALHDAYTAGGRAPTVDGGSNPLSARHWLAVIERVLAIGRMVIADKRFSFLPTLVDREVAVSSGGYSYASWIRHAQVTGTQQGLIPERGGNLLSAVRQLLGQRSWLRPDVATPVDPEPGSTLDPNDRLLNDLAQFDLWWCVMAQAHRKREIGWEFYPSCAALHQYRCQPAIDAIATNDAARAAAFPGEQITTIATALAVVLKAAERESWQYGGFWAGDAGSSPATSFISQYANS